MPPGFSIYCFQVRSRIVLLLVAAFAVRADVRDCVCDPASPEAEKHPVSVAMWNMAIAKGRELWGDGWAVALNGDIARRQCHEYVHIGKTGRAIYVDGPSELPVIADGAGRLHVQTGEQFNETVLMR